MKKSRIVFIGAGSYGFTYTLVEDILSYEELKESEFVFMDIDKKRLDNLKILINQSFKSKGIKNKSLFLTDRKKALDGANFVINLVKIGGLKASEFDMDVPKKFGLFQTIGDTCGIGGVFRGLRTMPFTIKMAKEMEEVSDKNAVILNYTNPQSMLVMANSLSTSIPFIGLCHSVQHTTKTIAEYMDIPYDRLDFEAAGINHISWITKLYSEGKDIYPKLKEFVKERGLFDYKPGKEDPGSPFLGPSRLDMLNRVGYVVTESSVHFPEYVPYYLRTPELIEKYKITIDKYKDYIAVKEKEYKELIDQAKEGKLPSREQSHEYGAIIINSMVTNKPTKIYANVMNDGLISNLPAYSSVEVACLVDRNGVQPCRYGELPNVLAGLCESNIRVHQMAVDAVHKRDKNYIYYALMLDPYTGTKLNLDEMKEVADILIEKHKVYLEEIF